MTVAGEAAGEPSPPCASPRAAGPGERTSRSAAAKEQLGPRASPLLFPFEPSLARLGCALAGGVQARGLSSVGRPTAR